MEGRFIAYYRVSTEQQGMHGNGMAAQRKAVEDYLNGGRWKLVAEFTEVESGKRADRPELAKAITACKKHRAKLVIAKLDRLSRNVHFISGLMERKVDFVACDMPSANAFMRKMSTTNTQLACAICSCDLFATVRPGQGDGVDIHHLGRAHVSWHPAICCSLCKEQHAAQLALL
jgi:hypothetical protein